MDASVHDVAEFGRATDTTAPSGLTSEEAAERLSESGPNEAVALKGASGLWEFLLLFLNPLVLILLVASLVSFALGDKADAIIILVIVLLSISINFLQSYRSQKAIDRLRERVTTTATVLRDGKWGEIKRREIVPGDIVRLSAGDLVPADAKLLESRDLFVQQAALTGESLPSEKHARAKSDSAGPDSQGHVFLGTSVVSGTATAEVFATGARTQFGSIASQLRHRPLETDFERSMRHFGLLITRVVFFLVLFIVIVRVAMHKDAFESFLFAVALAVGLTPEFLPMISAVTLASGAVRMAHAQVVVKHLPAIQNLGTIDVFCSDKTGTLTTGQMVLVAHADYLGSSSERVLELGYANSKLETGIKSPLDLAVLNCAGGEANEYRKCDEIPFDFERRRLSVVAERENDGASRTMITKGAPEGIFPCCTWCEANGRIVPFGSVELACSRRTFAELSEQGFRVLAVAYRSIEERPAYSFKDETGLTFAGYLAFSDPPNPDAGESLALLKRDGVEVKILTGDNELVARHVCGQVGIEEPTILSGEELDRASDAALPHLVEETTVFARVSPMQKHRIIQALKLRGHVVGYMGDGINDAPSLHTADVGISVSSAVDVARDAADIILLQPGLNILHEGIVEGRRASANVMKYVLMGTSSNFGNMFSMAVASVFLPFLPMLPTQVLLNNFLYDMAQITIPSDRVDEQYIRRPRRWNMTLIRNFMIFIGPISSLYDFLTFFVLLYFFHAGQREFHTGWFVESLATQTLVLFVIRTMGNPLKSRPSAPLAITTSLIAIVACVLPFSPFATVLGFAPLPARYFAFLAVSTATYLLLVEFAKRQLFARADL